MMILGGVANPSFRQFFPSSCQGSIVRAWRMKLDPENRALAQPVKLLVDGLDGGISQLSSEENFGCLVYYRVDILPSYVGSIMESKNFFFFFRGLVL